MKKFKFHLSSSSESSSDDSDVSDDEMPDLNVPSQIKKKEQPKIDIENQPNQNLIFNASNEIQTQNSENSNSTDSNKNMRIYKSFLAQRAKSLMEAFSSDDEKDKSKNLNQDIDEDKYEAKLSSSISDESDKNENFDSAGLEIEEKEVSDSDLNQESSKKDQDLKKSQSHRTVNMHLKIPEIPLKQRQKKLMSSIKMIYDFFDHKISVQSIIFAIHDHAGMLKEAISTLNKYPNKYENYSLHDLPNNSAKISIQSYLQIHE